MASPHFELFTSGSIKKARSLVLGFETARQLFRTVSPALPSTEFPVRIIAFRSPEEYSRYSLSANTEAYFLCRPNHDYIVMQQNDPNVELVAAHEYAHYILHSEQNPPPAWLHEGLAEYYSNLESHPDGVLVGFSLPENASLLARSELLPLDTLFAATGAEITHGDLGRGTLFYAESWALVHMLQSSERYHGQFRDFLARMNSGQTAAAAIHASWGVPVSHLERDLRQYILRARFQPCFFSVPEPLAADPAAVSAINVSYLSEVEIETLLADLTVKLRRFPEAERILAALSENNPRDASVEEALAYLYVEERSYSEAAWHCSQAIAKGSVNPRLYVQYARLLKEMRISSENLAFYLKRALDLKPDYLEARLELAQILPNADCCAIRR